jgi:hypothetical protein
MPRDFAKTGNGALSLNGSSQALVVANPNRVELTICNPGGTNAMWLAFGTPASTSSGTAVAPTAAANTGLRLGPGQTYTTTNYRGPVAILGTAADIATYVEF